MPDPQTAAVVKTTIQPYTLKPSGDTLSRDVLATWKEVQLSHMRQNEYWKQFLPGGTNAEWKASDDAVQIKIGMLLSSLHLTTSSLVSQNSLQLGSMKL